MGHGLPSDFGWFTAWVDQQLGVSLTFARGVSREGVLEGFNLRPRTAVEETFKEACADPERPKVRVGELSGWGYAVEHFTARGDDPPILCRLSGNGGEALALVYTQTVNSFMYAADGDVVSGFDLTVPQIRYGRDEHRFDATMERAGFLGPDVRERTPQMGARFVQLTFGITIDQQMLERPLLSVELGMPDWGRLPDTRPVPRPD